MPLRDFPKKNHTVVLVLLFVVTIQAGGFLEARSEMEIIRERIVAELTAPPIERAHIASLLDTMNEDGSWPGINYENLASTAFEHREHYSNIVALARAYRKPEQEFEGSERIRKALVTSLSFWVENDFICNNWWYNQIGTPTALVTVLLLMDDELDAPLVKATGTIVGRAHVNAWGARQSGDRIKIAGIQAKHLLVTGNKQRFDEIIKIIEGEIKFTTGRGMQHDYSFHHRTDRVNNTLSYGLGYADAFAEWAFYVAGTSYALSPERIQLLIDYYLDGICKQMVYGKRPDIGALNRGVSRPRALRVHGTKALERLVSVSDYREVELKEIIAIRRGKAQPSRSFAASYWQSEHFTLQRPNFFTSVRMHSRRNQTMEYPYNAEGILNHHRGDGTNHISVNGDEYEGIAPVFDYQKVPGATIMQKVEMPPEGAVRKPGLTDFVGAVTDGLYGAVAFDFISPHDPMRAKKSWFFFDQEYVCLGAAIEGYAERPVVTTLNQCRLDGVVLAMVDGARTAVDRGDHELAGVEWVLHDGVAYVFPGATALRLSNQAQTGSDYRINHQSRSSREPVGLDVFKIWIDHGPAPKGASYAYMVIPSTNETEVSDRSGFRDVEILSNTDALQAVRHNELEMFQAAFHKSGILQVTEGLTIRCESQGMLMGKYDQNGLLEVSVSDPSRKLKRIHFSTTGRVFGNGGNSTVEWDQIAGQSHVSIDLPQGSYTGKSVTVRF